MKTLSVVLVGYMGLLPVCKVTLGRFVGAQAAYEANKFKEVMEASDTDKTEGLKNTLDKFFGVMLTYIVQKEEQDL